MEWISEWVCVEHEGFARRKAEAWWASRCQGECPTSAEDAFDFGATKCLSEPYSITTKIKPGDKFSEITGYKFREPGEDDLGDMDDGQAVEMLDQIPF
jgi:DNA repair protein RadD